MARFDVALSYDLDIPADMTFRELAVLSLPSYCRRFRIPEPKVDNPRKGLYLRFCRYLLAEL
jgi:hypothetical protein